MNNTAENNSKNSNDINENSKSLRKLSVVVSVYNEEKALREFYKETNKILEQIRKPGLAERYSTASPTFRRF